MAFKAEWIPKYENNLIIQTANTDAYLGWYKTENIRNRLDFDGMEDPELKKYIACLGSDICIRNRLAI